MVSVKGFNQEQGKPGLLPKQTTLKSGAFTARNEGSDKCDKASLLEQEILFNGRKYLYVLTKSGFSCNTTGNEKVKAFKVVKIEESHD